MVVRDMFDAGYITLVVFPQYIAGWKRGRVTSLRAREDEGKYSPLKFKSNGGLTNFCMPDH
jgi:hypothetical protein